MVQSIVAVRGLIGPYQRHITELDAGDFLLVLGISAAIELNDALQTTRRTCHRSSLDPPPLSSHNPTA
jgi:hypothetical protein